YRPSCLIHGDIRRENWVLAGARPPRALKLIDWELSGRGDPAWDLGSVLAEILLDRVRSGRAARAESAPLHEPLFASFARAYRAGSGLVDLSRSEECDKIVLFAAARLLHIALEWTEAGSSQADVVVECARALADQRSVWCDCVFRAAKAEA